MYLHMHTCVYHPQAHVDESRHERGSREGYMGEDGEGKGLCYGRDKNSFFDKFMKFSKCGA